MITAKFCDCLFHYTSKARALERILPEMQLRMGSFSETNDPRENKEWDFEFAISKAEIQQRRPKVWEAWREKKRAQQLIRVLCFTLDEPKVGKKIQHELRGYGLDRMWDRYGERHSGVCLAFNRYALSANVNGAIGARRFFKEQCVTYAVLSDLLEQKPDIYRAAYAFSVDGVNFDDMENALVNHVERHADILLFTKSKDWEGEREYRFALSATGMEEVVNIPIETSLTGVIVGPDFSEHYFPSLKRLCERAGVTPFRLVWQFGYADRLEPI